jgi:DNA helicase-2/ATP-dependent DNA helicase PcrA
MQFDLSVLNDRQIEAVTVRGGALMVLAGAGSGKTRVITYRIARLIHDGVYAHNILAVTFTNKAAREMRDRIDALVGERSRRLWMGTFHAICGRMLREDGSSIGLNRSFVIYDDSDQMSLVRKILKNEELHDKSFSPRGVLSEISRAKEHMLTPDLYSDRTSSYFERVVARLYTLYQSQLLKNNALDFDDMLLKTVWMLDQRQDIREKYQHRFHHILVDEFQDVNHVQYKLVSTLCGLHGNITIVGDDDQSIYSWRGADAGLMQKFVTDFPDVKIIKLEQNYRSTKPILDAAHEVIRHNRSRSNKRLWTENSDGVPVTISECGTEQDEAMLVGKVIRDAVESGKRKYSDYAVLYRTNAQSRSLEEAFLVQRIPHILVGGQRFYERKEIKDMIAYLRLAANPHDDVSFLRVINSPPRGIGTTSLSNIEAYATQHGLSLWEAIQKPACLMYLQRRAVDSLTRFVGCILGAIQIAKVSDDSSFGGETEPVLRHLLSQSGYLDFLRTEHTEDAENRLENLQELVVVASRHDATSEETGLVPFLQEIALLTDADAVPDREENQGFVTLMTVHTAKGLEFPVVFVVGLEEGVFPHSRSMSSDQEIEEERRLCYVAMTRAMQELHLLYASRRSSYGLANYNPRSRFLDAIPPELTDSLTPQVSPSRSVWSSGTASVSFDREGGYSMSIPLEDPLFDSEGEALFEIGQQVRHPKFGVGMVVSCVARRGDYEVTVAFPGVTGVKKLMAGIAGLEPL